MISCKLNWVTTASGRHIKTLDPEVRTITYLSGHGGGPMGHFDIIQVNWRGGETTWLPAHQCQEWGADS